MLQAIASGGLYRITGIMKWRWATFKRNVWQVKMNGETPETDGQVPESSTLSIQTRPIAGVHEVGACKVLIPRIAEQVSSLTYLMDA